MAESDTRWRTSVADFNHKYDNWCQELRIEQVDGRARKAALEAFGCYQKQAKFGDKNKRAWFGLRIKGALE